MRSCGVGSLFIWNLPKLCAILHWNCCTNTLISCQSNPMMEHNVTLFSFVCAWACARVPKNGWLEEVHGTPVEACCLGEIWTVLKIDIQSLAKAKPECTHQAALLFPAADLHECGLYMYCTGGTECLSRTPASHQHVPSKFSPSGNKISSFRIEPMLSCFYI